MMAAVSGRAQGGRSRWVWPTLRLRPLAFTAFAMVTVLGAVAVAFYLADLSAETVFLERERDEALAERQILTEVYDLQGIPGLLVRMERRARLAAREEHYGLYDASGRRLGGDLLAEPRHLPTGEWGQVRARTKAGRVVLDASAERLPDGALLVVGRDASGRREFQGRLADGLLIGLAIVVAASLGVGLMLNSLVIRRAEAVAGVAERIAAGELGARAARQSS